MSYILKINKYNNYISVNDLEIITNKINKYLTQLCNRYRYVIKLTLFKDYNNLYLNNKKNYLMNIINVNSEYNEIIIFIININNLNDIKIYIKNTYSSEFHDINENTYIYKNLRLKQIIIKKNNKVINKYTFNKYIKIIQPDYSYICYSKITYNIFEKYDFLWSYYYYYNNFNIYIYIYIEKKFDTLFFLKNNKILYILCFV